MTADDLPQWLRATLRLRAMILEGSLRAGERVSEIPLAAQLGVSRTPLRLALARLEHEGLLEPAPGGGFAVASFTLEEAADAIDLRGVLEGTAARLAAERLEHPDELEGMHGCVAQIDALIRPERPAIGAFERYVELPESGRILYLAQAQHRGMLEAIEAREGARAEALGREHARLARRNLDVALDGSHRALERLPGAGLIRTNGSR